MEQEKSSKKKSVKFWAVALLLGALLLFIVGGYPLIKQIALDGFGLEATGTVVGVSGADRIQTPSYNLLLRMESSIRSGLTMATRIFDL